MVGPAEILTRIRLVPYRNEDALRLQAEIEKDLPDFARAVRSASDAVTIHQDSFAADLQPSELILLGKAVKYAGLLGKNVQIIGRHRETI